MCYYYVICSLVLCWACYSGVGGWFCGGLLDLGAYFYWMFGLVGFFELVLGSSINGYRIVALAFIYRPKHYSDCYTNKFGPSVYKLLFYTTSFYTHLFLSYYLKSKYYYS